MPALAEYGLASVAFYALAVIGLLGPTALVSSELGAAWPRTGGIYVGRARRSGRVSASS